MAKIYTSLESAFRAIKNAIGNDGQKSAHSTAINAVGEMAIKTMLPRVPVWRGHLRDSIKMVDTKGNKSQPFIKIKDGILQHVKTGGSAKKVITFGDSQTPYARYQHGAGLSSDPALRHKRTGRTFLPITASHDKTVYQSAYKAAIQNGELSMTRNGANWTQNIDNNAFSNRAGKKYAKVLSRELKKRLK